MGKIQERMNVFLKLDSFDCLNLHEINFKTPQPPPPKHTIQNQKNKKTSVMQRAGTDSIFLPLRWMGPGCQGALRATGALAKCAGFSAQIPEALEAWEKH